ncbi:MAG: IS4 family transposase [Flavobacterium sp.]
MQKGVTVNSLLKLIDKAILESIAIETKVDYKAKKLSGEVIFKLILMSILDDTKVSLRIMEKVFASNMFKLFSGVDRSETIKFSSISERLSAINHEYFEKIFQNVFHFSKSYFKDGLDVYNIRQFDSTSLSVSSKLLKKGMVNGLKNKNGEHTKNQIKFTIGLYNNLPLDLNFHNQQQYLGEDIALGEAILNANINDNEIVVFDRGLKKRKTFKEFNDKNISFVTRINPTKSIKIIEENKLSQDLETETLKILSDEKVNLFHEKKCLFKEPFRLIKAESRKTREVLFFLTNIEDLRADEITCIYRKRWDIEVFFKFIKQHLHFKHFLSYSENGVKVMMYMTMITAILLLIYKKVNEIKSYKIAKFQFTQELNMEIIKEIVVICDGNPSKSPLFNTT